MTREAGPERQTGMDQTSPQAPLTARLAFGLGVSALTLTLWPVLRLSMNASLGDSFGPTAPLLLGTLAAGVVATVVVLFGWKRQAPLQPTALVLGLLAAVVSVFELFVFFVGGFSGR